ncbi:Endonuclease/Exonuclease/phosphatase family protein [Cryptosporidium hominis]|nr:DNA-(apurinic or apyrimidinic site) lyase 2 [Cryptosporidium hominis]PPA63631.1 Endonuclease/Exonuclease/phosphatase family protein [Cryptosporidium hominis]
MRELSIISFNVNGLISFTKRRGYTESIFSKLLDNICVNDEVTNANLNVESPDIICLQECKMSFGDDLNNSIGCPGNYESYFSLAENNKRYSGVATYSSKKTMVIEAAKGFSWLESNPCQFDINQMIQTEKLQEIESNISKIKDKYGISISEIDGEGRCVITDHKQFVLLNLYVPLLRSKAEEKEEKEKEEVMLKEIQNQNETQIELSETVDPERFKYRLAFQEYLNLLLHVLKNACKRNVILAGDFNIILEKIDCYDDCGILDNCKLAPCVLKNTKEILETSSFAKAYMHMRRMNIEMIKGYCLVDAYRHYYPRTNNKYTCWSQMNQSRIRNQGTRIDLFLVSKGLISESIKCEILDHIYGSDHCPILLILKTGEFESLYNNEKRKPPSICSKYLPQCKQRQSTISQFLTLSKIEGQINKTIKNHDFKMNNKISLNHPQCKHGIPCVKKKVTKSGVNKGRLYWSCPKSDQQKCNTFSWIEETNSDCKTNHDLKNFVIR